MTIDETPRGHASGGETPGMAKPRSGARDLERYAGLFARRTQVMKSSAMRDLMAVTARPEVISLAGGLPDTSTFPAEDFASLMTRVGVDDAARALQYGPTEGLNEVKDPIAQVMAAEGMEVEPEDLLVTTGGQQVIDLVCKTLIDPGDVIIAEAPTYPGAVPVFVSYQADVVQIEMDQDGMRIDVLEDNPYGMLRYEGEPLPTLFSLDGGEFVIYLGTFSKILSPGIRIGWTSAPRPVLDKLNLGKGAADLCSSPLSQLFVRQYFADRDWLAYVRELTGVYRRRRDIMLEALAEHFPREATWTRPQGGLFIWARMPDYIDTTDLLARALREHVAFVPGRAAYLDGRGGSEMRLNFSGVGDDDIREGIRRIGEVIREQVGLYETLTGKARPGHSRAAGDRGGQAAQAGARQRDPDAPDARVLPLHRRTG